MPIEMGNGKGTTVLVCGAGGFIGVSSLLVHAILSSLHLGYDYSKCFHYILHRTQPDKRFSSILEFAHVPEMPSINFHRRTSE